MQQTQTSISLKSLKASLPSSAVIVDVTKFDRILVNTSGGKDSAVMAHFMVGLAAAAGVLDRIQFTHSTFAEEWAGTEQLVERQIAALGFGTDKLHIVTRRDADGNTQSLLEYVVARRVSLDDDGMVASVLAAMAAEAGCYGIALVCVSKAVSKFATPAWPSSSARFCTSEFKRGPIEKVIRSLKGERILNCIGIRAAESTKRAEKNPFEENTRVKAKGRTVMNWYPIFNMSDRQVWEYIERHDIEMHQAYALGMPRLSCVFCVMAPVEALMLAGKHNPALLAKYVEVERLIGNSFQGRKGTKKDGALKGQFIPVTLADVQARLERGEEPGAVKTWVM